MMHPWSGTETGPLDDAALIHPDADQSIVFTMDVITPIVDDPVAFGHIAAANALSDVYAMGGDVQVALSFAGMPEELGLDVLSAVLCGMSEKAIEGGCAIVGGHTIKDSEPKCGLAVIGSVRRDRVWSHRGAKAGQAIVLTKPIGTGVIAQAMKKGEAADGALAAAVKAMSQLNAAARDAGRAHGATAATDVTGFGLLGHLHHIVDASGVQANLDASAVPLLPGARQAAQAGHVPGGSKRNLKYVEAHLDGTDDIDPDLLHLLADAQTSGGLMLTLPVDGARAVVDTLDGATIIGELVDGDPGRIRIR